MCGEGTGGGVCAPPEIGSYRPGSEGTKRSSSCTSGFAASASGFATSASGIGCTPLVGDQQLQDPAPAPVSDQPLMSPQAQVAPVAHAMDWERLMGE